MSRSRVVDQASGSLVRCSHFLAALDEQVCSAASGLWRQIRVNQPTHSEARVLETVPPLPEYPGFGPSYIGSIWRYSKQKPTVLRHQWTVYVMCYGFRNECDF